MAPRVAASVILRGVESSRFVAGVTAVREELISCQSLVPKSRSHFSNSVEFHTDYWSNRPLEKIISSCRAATLATRVRRRRRRIFAM
jgi:hypothetical protein